MRARQVARSWASFRHVGKSVAMPLLISAFLMVLPIVIWGAPTGRGLRTQPVSNMRGVLVMGMRATWPAQRKGSLLL